MPIPLCVCQAIVIALVVIVELIVIKLIVIERDLKRWPWDRGGAAGGRGRVALAVGPAIANASSMATMDDAFSMS